MPANQYVGAVTVKKRKGITNYWAYYRDSNGKQRLRSLETNNLKEATARARKIDDAIQTGTDQRLESIRKDRATTLAAVIESFVKVCSWSPTTLDRNRSRMKLINERFGDIPIAQITPNDIGLYLQKIVETRSVATRNRYLAIFSKVFRYAFENALIPNNPTDGFEQLKTRKIAGSFNPKTIRQSHECPTPLRSHNNGYTARHRHACRLVT